jgi:nucleoside-diphosphate-sugar epimerase
VVFHLASRFLSDHSPNDIENLIRDNITFGSMLVEAMVRAGSKRLVNAGTSWEHYQNASYSPVCLYAATKQAFEAILRYYADAEALWVVTLKLYDTYGPGDRRGKLLSRLAKMIHDGSSLAMSPGKQLIDLVHVDDVVNAFLIAAARLLTDEVTGMEDYAVSSGCPRTLRDIAALLERCAGAPLKIEWGGRPYRFREVMVPWSTGAPVPGWSPHIGLEEGLKMVLAENV